MTSRIAKVALCAAMSVAVAPAALAASGETLKIKGKKHVKANHAQKMVVSGVSPKSRSLSIFLGGTKCGASYSKEFSSSLLGGATLLGTQTVKGHFKQPVKIAHSSAGTHYLCAYLWSSSKTDRHASFKYVTK